MTSYKYFVGIGVSNPQGMTQLPGVENSVGQMALWAQKQDYQTIKITDQEHPVTASRIRSELYPLLSTNAGRIGRIVVYFAGHGFLAPPDQVWILSDGPSVNTGRISRNMLRSSISTYFPKQISVISDACLQARVFGSGSVSVLDDNPGPPRRVFVDNIYSTSPNEPAFFFVAPTRQEEFCLFTSVLLDFLKGQDIRAFRLANGMISRHVTTQTLYFNLPDAVLERAAELGVDQEPQIQPGFPQGEDTYSFFPEDYAAMVLTGEPTLQAGDSKDTSGPTEGKGKPGSSQSKQELVDREVIYQSSSRLEERLKEDKAPVPPLLGEGKMIDLRDAAEALGESLIALVHHSGPNASWGVIVNEGPTGFFTGPIPDPDNDARWLPILRSDLDQSVPNIGRRPRTVLSLAWQNGPDARENSFFAVLPTFDGLIATVHIRNCRVTWETGCTQLSWFPEYSCSQYAEQSLRAWRVLTALTSGRLVSSDAIAIADDLRLGKHANPMLGITCAYLYDLVGDLDSLSRLCHFYVLHDQSIPFDIALLSGGRIIHSDQFDGLEVEYPAANKDRHRAALGAPKYLWRSTPAGVGRVAGAAPLVRTGWYRLATQKVLLLRELAQLANRLTFTPIATLIGDEAREECVRVLRALRIM